MHVVLYRIVHMTKMAAMPIYEKILKFSNKSGQMRCKYLYCSYVILGLSQ